MNYFKKILVLVCMLFILTGCSLKQYDVVKIDKNKNVTFSITVGLDKELLDNVLKISTGNKKVEITDEMEWEYLDKAVEKYEGWNKERYTKDDYKGYILTYNKSVHIDDLLIDNEIDAKYFFMSNENVEESPLFKKIDNEYESIMKVGLPDEYEAIGKTSYDALDMSFTLELPNKSISNNADNISKDGKKLTWVINDVKDIEVKFKFVDKSWILYVIIVVVFIIFIISLIIMINRKK